MKVLKAIGGVFVKIWHWIKNTAWVQPLLIVGIIFGVIFSIPAITSGIQGLINNSNNSENYFKDGRFFRSMEKGDESDCDKIFVNYDKYSDYTEEQKSTIPQEDFKFFLMFTKSGDSDLENLKTSFETLEKNWGKDKLYVPTDDKAFRLYTIFTDEVTTETTTKESAFYQFLDRRNHFFEEACEVGLNSNYFINDGLTKDQLEKTAECDPDNFTTPVIYLIDWNGSKYYGKDGISQIMYSVSGENENVRAKLLLDCWNGTNKFAPSKPNN